MEPQTSARSDAPTHDGDADRSPAAIADTVAPASRRGTALIVIVAAGFSLWAAHAAFVADRADVYAENGPIENVQVALLALACLLFLAVSFRGDRARRTILVFCTVLCLNFVLRELDVEKLDVPAAVKLVGHGTGRNVLLILAYVALGVAALRRRSSFAHTARAFVRSTSGRRLLAAGACLVVAKVLDYDETHPHARFFEEMAELAGYVAIVLAALAAPRFRPGEA